MSHPSRARLRTRTLLGILVPLLLVVAGAAAVGGWLTGQDRTPEDPCPVAQAVTVAADPSIAPALSRALRDTGTRPLGNGVCAEVTVRAEPAAVTAAALADPGSDAAPDLWVPDSSVWLSDAAGTVAATDTVLTSLGSLVSTPLVVATSPEASAGLGWSAAAPTWQQALTTGRELAVGNLPTSAAGLQSLLALRATVADADQLPTALAQAAVALDDGEGPADPAAELAAAATGGAGAGVVPSTEQQVFVHNRGGGPLVLAVYPGDGSASLEYPLVRLDTGGAAQGTHAGAVEGVVRVLELQGRDAALADGFREPVRAGATTTEAGVPVLGTPGPGEVRALLADVEELRRPSRVLLVFDASVSMRAVTGDGRTRAELARDAAQTAVGLLDDGAAVGLWFFAFGLGQDPAGAPVDHAEVVPLRPLTESVGGVGQRDLLGAGAATLPQRLAPGGTGLYDTTLAAVRTMRAAHEEGSTSTVLLVTDGREEDPVGPGLEALVATLGAEADPDRPVRVVAVGLGTEVDAAELDAVSAATGGAAYLAEDPAVLPTVLEDALRPR